LAAISNTDYEGEIKNQGDTVVIRTADDHHQGLPCGGLLKRASIFEQRRTEDDQVHFNLILDDVTKSSPTEHDEYVSDDARSSSIVVDTAVLKSLLVRQIPPTVALPLADLRGNNPVSPARRWCRQKPCGYSWQGRDRRSAGPVGTSA
jgi:hypothetical protein